MSEKGKYCLVIFHCKDNFEGINTILKSRLYYKHDRKGL
jgi:hypothetical protein